jgi:hypothetical protein
VFPKEAARLRHSRIVLLNQFQRILMDEIWDGGLALVPMPLNSACSLRAALPAPPIAWALLILQAASLRNQLTQKLGLDAK